MTNVVADVITNVITNVMGNVVAGVVTNVITNVTANIGDQVWRVRLGSVVLGVCSCSSGVTELYSSSCISPSRAT